MSGELKLVAFNDDVAIDETLFPFVLPRTLDFINTIGARIAPRAASASSSRAARARSTSSRATRRRNRCTQPEWRWIFASRTGDVSHLAARRRSSTSSRTHVIEATEERHPPHFHVAVLDRAAAQYAAAIKPSTIPASTGEVAGAVPPNPVAPMPMAAPMGPRQLRRHNTRAVATDSAERSDPPSKPTEAGARRSTVSCARRRHTLGNRPSTQHHGGPAARGEQLGSRRAIRPGQLLKLP